MTDELIPFLQQRFHASSRNLIPLGAGMFSQAFRFETNAGSFVLRIGVTREAFEKDKLAYERLGHVAPVPEVLVIGVYNGTLFYCISTFLPGQILTGFEKAETELFLPSLFNNLLAVSRVPVPIDTGFGILNGAGKSRREYDSWADYIGAIDDFSLTFTPRGDEIYKPWNELLTTTFLDAAIISDVRQHLVDLLPFLPNDRHYVHGDFGYENALADGPQLTAILDWAELRCGDWLYDLAYIAYYDTKGVDYVGAFRQWADRQNLAIPNLTKRFRAYSLHMILGAIFLEANRGQRDWYEEDIERYRQLIQQIDR